MGAASSTSSRSFDQGLKSTAPGSDGQNQRAITAVPIYSYAVSKENQEFHNITEAQSALSEDIPARQKKYFISMMIRTLCFLLAVFTPSPYRWFFLFGAITLPYISVIVANAGRETIKADAKLLRGRLREIGR